MAAIEFLILLLVHLKQVSLDESTYVKKIGYKIEFSGDIKFYPIPMNINIIIFKQEFIIVIYE